MRLGEKQELFMRLLPRLIGVTRANDLLANVPGDG